ncbi:MAG: HTH-type transcriptional regulator BhcR [Pseudomonadota bacterium]
MMGKEESEGANPQPSRSRGRPRSFYSKAEESTIKALERGVRILKIVADADGLALSEIADEADESAATTYRSLLTLNKEGLVEFNERMQLWYVGVAAFRIGSAFLRRTSIMECSRPIMEDVMSVTGETSNLAIIDEDHVVFVSQVETHQPIRAFFRPGTRGPVHASGIGKALLAYRSDEEFDTLVQNVDLERFTEKTLSEEAALRADMDLIRKRGWAIDDEERTAGMRCIAAPIFNAHGEAIAGISISGPAVRVATELDDEFGKLILEAADKITMGIGGKRPEAAQTRGA